MNAHSTFKYNQPKTEIPTSIYKMGAISVKLFDLLTFHHTLILVYFGYVHIINSSLNKCIY